MSEGQVPTSVAEGSGNTAETTPVPAPPAAKKKKRLRGFYEDDDDPEVEETQAATLEHTVSLEELRKLKDTFDEVGEVDLEEFIEKIGPLIKENNPACTDEDLELMFMRIDANANDSVDWGEISDYLLTNEQKETKKLTAVARANEFAANPRLARLGKAVQGDARKVYHSDPVTHMMIHPRLPRYVTASHDGMVKFWNADTLQHEMTPHCGKCPVTDVSFSHWDTTICVAAMDSSITFYNEDSGELYRQYVGGRKRTILNARGQRIPDDRRQFVERRKFTLPMNTHFSDRIQYSGEEDVQGLGNVDMSVPVLKHFQEDQKFEATVLENLGYLQNPEKPGVWDSLGYPTAVETYSHGGQEVLLVGLQSGHLQLFGLSNSVFGNPISTPMLTTTPIHAHWDAVTRLKCVPKLEMLLTVSNDATIQVRHLERIEDVGLSLGEGWVPPPSSSTRMKSEGYYSSFDTGSRGHIKRITNIDWDDSRRLIASCAPECDPLLWSPYMDKPLARLEDKTSDKNRSPVIDVKFNGKHGQLMSLSADNSIRLWDLRTYHCIQVLQDTKNKRGTFLDDMRCIGFDKKRESIVAATHKLKSWSALHNTEFPTGYRGHRKPLVGVCYCDRFSQLITADNTIIIVWDLPQMHPGMQWEVPEEISGLQVDLKQRRLLVSTFTGHIFVYNYVNGYLLATCQPPTKAALKSTATTFSPAVTGVAFGKQETRVTKFKSVLDRDDDATRVEEVLPSVADSIRETKPSNAEGHSSDEEGEMGDAAKPQGLQVFLMVSIKEEEGKAMVYIDDEGGGNAPQRIVNCGGSVFCCEVFKNPQARSSSLVFGLSNGISTYSLEEVGYRAQVFTPLTSAEVASFGTKSRAILPGGLMSAPHCANLLFNEAPAGEGEIQAESLPSVSKVLSPSSAGPLSPPAAAITPSESHITSPNILSNKSSTDVQPHLPTDGDPATSGIATGKKNKASLAEIRAIQDHTSQGTECLIVMDDPCVIISGSDSGWIHFWDFERQEEFFRFQHSFQHHDGVYCLAFGPSKDTLLVGDQSGYVSVYDISCLKQWDEVMQMTDRAHATQMQKKLTSTMKAGNYSQRPAASPGSSPREGTVGDDNTVSISRKKVLVPLNVTLLFRTKAHDTGVTSVKFMRRKPKKEGKPAPVSPAGHLLKNGEHVVVTAGQDRFVQCWLWSSRKAPKAPVSELGVLGTVPPSESPRSVPHEVVLEHDACVGDVTKSVKPDTKHSPAAMMVFDQLRCDSLVRFLQDHESGALERRGQGASLDGVDSRPGSDLSNVSSVTVLPPGTVTYQDLVEEFGVEETGSERREWALSFSDSGLPEDLLQHTLSTLLGQATSFNFSDYSVLVKEANTYRLSDEARDRLVPPKSIARTVQFTYQRTGALARSDTVASFCDGNEANANTSVSFELKNPPVVLTPSGAEYSTPPALGPSFTPIDVDIGATTDQHSLLDPVQAQPANDSVAAKHTATLSAGFVTKPGSRSSQREATPVTIAKRPKGATIEREPSIMSPRAGMDRTMTGGTALTGDDDNNEKRDAERPIPWSKLPVSTVGEVMTFIDHDPTVISDTDSVKNHKKEREDKHRKMIQAAQWAETAFGNSTPNHTQDPLAGIRDAQRVWKFSTQEASPAALFNGAEDWRPVTSEEMFPEPGEQEAEESNIGGVGEIVVYSSKPGDGSTTGSGTTAPMGGVTPRAHLLEGPLSDIGGPASAFSSPSATPRQGGFKSPRHASARKNFTVQLPSLHLGGQETGRAEELIWGIHKNGQTKHLPNPGDLIVYPCTETMLRWGHVGVILKKDMVSSVVASPKSATADSRRSSGLGGEEATNGDPLGLKVERSEDSSEGEQALPGRDGVGTVVGYLYVEVVIGSGGKLEGGNDDLSKTKGQMVTAFKQFQQQQHHEGVDAERDLVLERRVAIVQRSTSPESDSGASGFPVFYLQEEVDDDDTRDCLGWRVGGFAMAPPSAHAKLPSPHKRRSVLSLRTPMSSPSPRNLSPRGGAGPHARNNLGSRNGTSAMSRKPLCTTSDDIPTTLPQSTSWESKTVGSPLTPRRTDFSKATSVIDQAYEAAMADKLRRQRINTENNLLRKSTNLSLGTTTAWECDEATLKRGKRTGYGIIREAPEVEEAGQTGVTEAPEGKVPPPKVAPTKVLQGNCEDPLGAMMDRLAAVDAFAGQEVQAVDTLWLQEQKAKADRRALLSQQHKVNVSDSSAIKQNISIGRIHSYINILPKIQLITKEEINAICHAFEVPSFLGQRHGRGASNRLDELGVIEGVGWTKPKPFGARTARGKEGQKAAVKQEGTLRVNEPFTARERRSSNAVAQNALKFNPRPPNLN